MRMPLGEGSHSHHTGFQEQIQNSCMKFCIRSRCSFSFFLEETVLSRPVYGFRTFTRNRTACLMRSMMIPQVKMTRGQENAPRANEACRFPASRFAIRATEASSGSTAAMSIWPSAARASPLMSPIPAFNRPVDFSFTK